MPFVDTDDHIRFAAEKLSKKNLFDSGPMVCDLYCLEPGQAQKVHAHAREAKVYYVIEGRGQFTLGDETRELSPGQMACSPAGELHGVSNTSSERLVLLVVIAPNPNLR